MNLMFDRIKELCKRKGLTIQALEQRAGISGGSISKWNDHVPRADALYRVAVILECSVDYLLYGDNPSGLVVTAGLPQPERTKDPVLYVTAGAQEKPASASADGLRNLISSLSPELRKEFVRFLVLAKANPEKALRFLGFLNQELESLL